MTIPARVRPGDAFLVVVRGVSRPRVAGAAPRAPSAQVAGRPLAFFPTAHGFTAVAALPVEAEPGRLRIAVELPVEPPAELPGGLEGARAGPEPRRLWASLEVTPPRFPTRDLTVGARFVEPRPPQVEERIEADRAALARAFAQPPSPPLFRGRFDWPRRDRVSARYGERRTFNGVKPSQHYGLDLAGREGAPVTASNGGEVVLVRDCWASGITVVVWHGAGLSTTYLHLSRALVREGERVERGQPVGEVGATGRSSGPHLHWGVKVGDLYVDPESVLRIAFAP